MVTTVTDNSPQSINTSLFAMDSEIQKVKKIAESFDEKLSGIDIETGVLSVNGKQGVVELTASDVDALPSSTVIPTTTSELENTSGFITINDVSSSYVPVTRKVNNKSLDKDITLTASDVGALPNTTVIPTKTSQLTNDSGFITSSGSITGNAATATTADKVKNALTVNGKTYDGSSAIDAGVQTIANGGTGASNGQDAFENIVSGVRTSSNPVDNETMLIRSSTWYKTTVLSFWEYIKGKISSVLGLTASSYGGKAATADKVVSAGASALWIYGRAGAICKTTSAGEEGGWKAFASIKTASGSIEIGNLSGEDFIRVVYSSDADVSANSNNITQIFLIKNRSVQFEQKIIATAAGIRIPTSQPSSLEDGDIWIS